MIRLLRNIGAVIVGVVIGGVVNMAIITLGPMVIPPPEGVDLADMDRFAENLQRLPPVNFIAPWLAHALGTFVGALVAARLSTSLSMTIALGIGVFFLVGGITMVVMFGGPLWFIAVDLIGAYLPMAYLGGKLGAERQTRSGTLASSA